VGEFLRTQAPDNRPLCDGHHGAERRTAACYDLNAPTSELEKE